MLLKPVRASFLIGLVAAAAVVPARASHPGSDASAAPAAASSAPATQTVQCIEYVPEKYTTTRTCYRYECRKEAYTCYRCEYVRETRTRTCTYYERVPEVRTVTRKVCTLVPVVEERTCLRPHWSYVTETKMVCRRVDRGHWECREVYSFTKDLRNRLHRLFHHNDCCCAECCQPCPTRVRKVWVPCYVTEQCPVQVCRKVCTLVPEKVKVTVCKPVYKEETCQVTCYRCVPRQRVETYTVCVPRLVPVQAYRTVRVCVPYEEKVTCCRLVPRVVTRQVPAAVAQCCSAPVCCEQQAYRCHRRHFRGFRHAHHDCCAPAASCCN
jgi:hypothetical protein